MVLVTAGSGPRLIRWSSSTCPHPSEFRLKVRSGLSCFRRLPDGVNRNMIEVDFKASDHQSKALRRPQVNLLYFCPYPSIPSNGCVVLVCKAADDDLARHHLRHPSVISATATQTETSNVDVPEEKNSQGAADKAEALGLFARTRKG